MLPGLHSLTESEFFPDAFARQFACDRDSLASFLQRAQGGSDCHLIAERLLNRFHGIAGVLAADVKSLLVIEGVLQQTAELIVEFGKLNLESERQKILSVKFNHESEAFRKYVISTLYGQKNEHFMVVYFDSLDRYINDELITSHERFTVAVSGKTIVKKSILMDASNILIAHNHPSGNPNPSDRDVRFTRELLRGLNSVEIGLFDHYIVSKGLCVSMRMGGWI